VGHRDDVIGPRRLAHSRFDHADLQAARANLDTGLLGIGGEIFAVGLRTDVAGDRGTTGQQSHEREDRKRDLAHLASKKNAGLRLSRKPASLTEQLTSPLRPAAGPFRVPAARPYTRRLR